MTNHSPRRAAVGAGLVATAAALGLGGVTALLVLRLLSTVSELDLPTLDARADLRVLGPLVEVPVLAIGAVVAAWWAFSYALVALALALRLLGIQSAALSGVIRATAPRAVRRLAVAGIGAGLVLSASPALATEPAPELGWVETQSTPPGETAPAPPVTETDSTTRPAEPSLPPRHPAPDTAAPVTVVEGQSLWSIAADHLPPGATDAEISAAWPAWHAANIDVIGDDPDLILPGQVLTAPDAHPTRHPTQSPPHNPTQGVLR